MFDWYDFVFNVNCWMHLQFQNVCAAGSLDTIAFRKYASTQHVFLLSNTQCDKIHEYTGIFWHKLVHTAVVSGYADCSAIFFGHAGTVVHLIRRMFVCCSFTRRCCRFWIHRYIRTHCSFTRWCCRFSEYTGIDGSTAVSHVGAAGSLNMRYDESVDTQPFCFSQRE